MQQWRFLDTGRRDAASNMALDEAILLTHEAGRTPPTLRVYGWTVPTLSLGYAQTTSQEVDLEACRQYGVTVIRRPTGGRAVLHDQEVTYSVILPTTWSQAHNTLTEHYRLISMALAAALQQLGLPVHVARSRRAAQTLHDTSSPACFAALARYELSVAGRKIVGSAQKRLRHALLQHGSIPLQMDRQRLFQCLRVSRDRRDTLIQEAYTTMTAVNEIATPPVRASALCDALRTSFASSFNVTLVDAPLRVEECGLAEQLRTTKYATPAWNLEGAAAWRKQEEERLGEEGEAGG